MPVEWERIQGGLAEDFQALDGDLRHVRLLLPDSISGRDLVCRL